MHKAICKSCKARYSLKNVTFGKALACKSCGGPILVAEKLFFVCDGCGHTSHSSRAIPLGKVPKCGKCQAPMRLFDDGATMPLQASVHEKPDSPQSEAVTIVQSPSLPFGGADPDTGETVHQKAKKDKPQPTPDIETLPGALQHVVTPSRPRKAPPPADDSLSLQPEGAGPGGISKEHFGKFLLRKEIARGGMGIVYQAHDPKVRRDVALKVLIAGEAASDEAITRFLREVRAAGQINHPNIIRVYEAGEHDGQHFFTMELIRGQDLDKVILQGEYDLEWVIELLADSCSALAVAHDNGIIHRDLKPANIMVDRKKRPVIMDFGLAKDTASVSFQSMSGAVMGTPAYMSPEQAQGLTHEIDFRTDVFSMGVILYHAATGERPFTGETFFEIIQAVVAEDPIPPMALRADISQDLNTIILKCMEKSPDARYENMYALAADLRRYLEGEPISARPVAPHIKLWRKLRRNTPAMIAAVAIPAIILVGCIVYALVAGGGVMARIEKDLASQEPPIRAAALQTLQSHLADPETSANDKAEGLRLARYALRDHEATVTSAAMTLVGNQQDPEALPALLAILDDDTRPLAHKQAAIEALQNYDPETMPNQAQLVEILGRQILKTEDTVFRNNAVNLLAASKHGSGRKMLRTIATNTTLSRATRVHAIQKLADGIRLHDPAMKDLLLLQGDEDPAIVAAAEDALWASRSNLSVFGFYGIHEQVDKAMVGVGEVAKLKAQRNREVAALLNEMDRETRTVSPVDKMLPKLKDADASVRMAAAFDLGKLGDARAVPALVDHLDDPDNGVRRAAGRALLKLSASKATIPTEKPLALLEHADPLVRENAAVLLGGLETKAALPPLMTALPTEKSPRTQRAMLRALGQIGDPSAATAVGAVLQNPTIDRNTATVAIKALTRFGKAGAPALIDALAHTSPAIRSAAQAALKEATGEDFGTDTGRWKSWLSSDG